MMLRKDTAGSPASMKWCCKPFEDLFRDEGDDGFRIVIIRSASGKRYFALQVETMQKSDDLTVWRTMRLGMGHCLACSRRLGRFYRKSIEALPVAPDTYQGNEAIFE